MLGSAAVPGMSSSGQPLGLVITAVVVYRIVSSCDLFLPLSAAAVISNIIMIYYFPLHSIIALAQAAPEVAPLSNFIMNLFPAQPQPQLQPGVGRRMSNGRIELLPVAPHLTPPN